MQLNLRGCVHIHGASVREEFPKMLTREIEAEDS